MVQGNMSDAILVLLIGDRPAFGDVLARQLERASGFEMLACVQELGQAHRASAGRAPDLILLDLDVEGIDAPGVTGQARAQFPEAKIVVVSALQSPESIALSLAAGACGFVPKGPAMEDVDGILRRAVAGEMIMPSSELPLVLDQLQHGASAPPVATELAQLTVRETEILRELAGGGSTAHVAEQLRISRFTVQSHVKSILAKLGVHSKIEAVTMAWRLGLAPRADEVEASRTA
jgi:DNA-binding NarL/FixJ family response regulator